MASDLSKKIAQKQGPKPAPPPRTRTMRKPTGLPSWPVALLASGPKGGKTFHLAKASASDMVDRTFWLGWGEQRPDAYGAIEGARFEIVEHDNTLADFRDALEYVVSIPSEGRPHLLGIDSSSRLWATLKDYGDHVANATGAPFDWTAVNGYWADILTLIRQHRGPVLLTARLDAITIIEDGNRTRTERLLGQKSIGYDVDAVIEFPERGLAHIVGARHAAGLPARVAIEDFTVEKFWQLLGLDTAETAPPTYDEPRPFGPVPIVP